MINPITVTMAACGGTSRAGPSHGGTSNSGNKLGDTMSQGYFLIIYIYIYNMQYAKYTKTDSMQNMQNMQINMQINNVIMPPFFSGFN